MNIYQHRLLKLLGIVTTLISFDISAVTLTYQPEWVRDVVKPLAWNIEREGGAKL